MMLRVAADNLPKVLAGPGPLTVLNPDAFLKEPSRLGAGA